MIDNRPPMEATGGAASRKPGRTPLLSPGRQISMEEEVITPPRGTVDGMVVWIVRRILDRRSIC